MRFQRRSLAAVIAFVAVTGSLITLTGVTFSRVRFADDTTYQATFADASNLRPGVDVRASGVAVGNITGVKLEHGRVRVSFQVRKSIPLTTTTEARIRYANLTGDRYLDLTNGSGAGQPLPHGATIPLGRTRPALDLDSLYAGFDPLMQALDPDEVNQLAANLIAVTQGQSGAIQKLLDVVASFTSKLADRDELISRTITDLSKALGTLDGQRGEVDDLITGLADLTHGLAHDRKEIGESLEGVNVLATDTAELLRRVRPDLKANIDQIAIVANVLNKRSATVAEILGVYKTALQTISRAGAYGSFFQFFMCSVKISVTLPNLPPIQTDRLDSDLDRCNWQGEH